MAVLSAKIAFIASTISAAAIVQRHAEHHALVPCRSFHRVVADIVLHAFRQFVVRPKIACGYRFLQQGHFRKYRAAIA
jgi:hypothetical protein